MIFPTEHVRKARKNRFDRSLGERHASPATPRRQRAQLLHRVKLPHSLRESIKVEIFLAGTVRTYGLENYTTLKAHRVKL